MAFTDFGLAKGLAVTPDWQGMISQEDKRFSMENDIVQQRRKQVEDEASKMELGTVYDDYNRGRYTDFVTGVMKEVTDFDTSHDRYEFDPKLVAQRNAIMNKIKNNPILDESLKTKDQAKALYDFIAQNPGSESLVQDQLAELSKTLKEGNTIGGTSQGFIFRKPEVRSIMDEITTMMPLVSKKNIQHSKGLFWTETAIDEGVAKERINEWLSQPMNAALAKQKFAQMSPIQQEQDQSPYQMMVRMLKSAYIPDKSQPQRMYTGTGREPYTKPIKADPSKMSAYNADLLHKTNINGNPRLRAWALSNYDEQTGIQYVANLNQKGEPVIAYRKPDGKTLGALAFPTGTKVEIVSGDKLFESDKYTGVEGRAQWEEIGKKEDIEEKYVNYPGFKIVGTTENGFQVELPSIFTPHNNPKTYDEYVDYMFPKTGRKQANAGMKDLGNGYSVSTDGLRMVNNATGQEYGPDGNEIVEE
jgi:hypothetical protein